MRILIYCPDRHILYDGNTPKEKGVGGGITARIRMAHALQRAGCQVQMVVNCKDDIQIDGVAYKPLDTVDRFDGDVAIINTSGDLLDLRPGMTMDFRVTQKILWVHGSILPKGLDEFQFDSVYAVSNYIRDVVTEEWGIQSSKVFVAYNAFDSKTNATIEASNIQKDPYRCIYFSHPSKGLSSALMLVKSLRKLDPRFHLTVYGGEALWGENSREYPEEEGIRYSGLVGQLDLAKEVYSSGVAIQLQSRQEPGALAIVEAMRAGCLLIGSNVGCYPEYIQNGRDGFIFDGDPTAAGLIDQVAECVYAIVNDKDALEYIRRNARRIPWSTNTMARVWIAHWDWLRKGRSFSEFSCPYCGGGSLLLCDGYHCTECGRYHRELDSVLLTGNEALSRA
jgi:glycosyltransferase involved in cell wall biosynthesis